jgi:predicted metal-dependent hydrolase
MEIRIIRSKRRKKTVSAREVNGQFIVRAPANMSDSDLQPIVENLQQRWQRRQARSDLNDKVLQRRAQALNQKYFKGKLKWTSLKWVTNQNSRYGSCTPADGTIRLSHRLATMPRFVLEYVIIHELAHLIEANHGDRFWALVNQYPKTERARGYLMAVGLEEIEA